MAPFTVKEIFGPTIQGEGAHAGSACVFLRFAACNLACAWCDTDFSPAGAARLDAAEIAERLIAVDENRARMVVVTGGEPALQWNPELAGTLAAAGFRVHMETNGTRVLAAPVDWITVSPKPQFHSVGEELVPGIELGASECKVVVDGTVGSAELESYEAHYDCDHWFVQPCDGPRYRDHLTRALELIGERPRWRLSLQIHKIVGVP